MLGRCLFWRQVQILGGCTTLRSWMIRTSRWTKIRVCHGRTSRARYGILSYLNRRCRDETCCPVPSDRAFECSKSFTSGLRVQTGFTRKMSKDRKGLDELSAYSFTNERSSRAPHATGSRCSLPFDSIHRQIDYFVGNWLDGCEGAKHQLLVCGTTTFYTLCTSSS